MKPYNQNIQASLNRSQTFSEVKIVKVSSNWILLRGSYSELKCIV